MRNLLILLLLFAPVSAAITSVSMESRISNCSVMEQVNFTVKNTDSSELVNDRFILPPDAKVIRVSDGAGCDYYVIKKAFTEVRVIYANPINQGESRKVSITYSSNSLVTCEGDDMLFNMTITLPHLLPFTHVLHVPEGYVTESHSPYASSMIKWSGVKGHNTFSVRLIPEKHDNYSIIALPFFLIFGAAVLWYAWDRAEQMKTHHLKPARKHRSKRKT